MRWKKESNCNKNVMNEDINDAGTLLTNDVNNTDSFSSIKVKILSSMKNIREKKERPDSNAIFEDLLKTDSTITEKSLLIVHYQNLLT